MRPLRTHVLPPRLPDVHPLVAWARRPGPPSPATAPVRKVADHLHRACRDVGFFYVVGHGLRRELPSEVLSLSAGFFALPHAQKQRISITNSPSYRGYQGLGENVTGGKRDLHEALDLFKEDAEAYIGPSSPIRGQNQWPEQPVQLRPALEEYVIAMLGLGKAIMRGIALALDAPPDTFEGARAGDPYWAMRLIGYPPLSQVTSQVESVEAGISCGEHTDYGLLTFVNQDPRVSALQVKNRDGHWIAANPVPGALVVNIGDMLKIWSNGIYQPTPHRVLNSSPHYRVSTPFFYEPNYDAVVAPLTMCLTNANPSPKYEPIIYGDHLTSKVLTNFA
eukprot:SM000020S05951  [mRNA]  locus=s20:126:2942:+ [translate_table: standard]